MSGGFGIGVNFTSHSQVTAGTDEKASLLMEEHERYIKLNGIQSVKRM